MSISGRNICAASRESIDKCLSAWQHPGIVRIEEGVIIVTDRTALEDAADLEER
jgi:hypothetical protein